MCQKHLKKYLLAFLLFWLPLVPAFSQENTVMTEKLSENSQQSSKMQEVNLNEFNSNMTNNTSNFKKYNNDSTISEQVSTNPLDLLNKQMSLLDDLDIQFQTLETQLELAESQLVSSKNLILQLQNSLESCKKQIDDLKQNLEKYNEALLSNKEDTSNLLGLLSEAMIKAQELETRINKLERQIKNNFWFNTIGITTASLIPITMGAVEYCNGNEIRGKDYMWTGFGFFIGAQLTYQSGHWIFEFW